jgi:hypothetical protein
MGLRARPRPDFIIAVPLHPVRRRERGHDQAGRTCTCARASDRCARDRGRARTDARDRGAERARATSASPESVARSRCGARRTRRAQVWAAVDVCTTGATLHEAMATLRAAGARNAGRRGGMGGVSPRLRWACQSGRGLLESGAVDRPAVPDPIRESHVPSSYPRRHPAPDPVDRRPRGHGAAPAAERIRHPWPRCAWHRVPERARRHHARGHGLADTHHRVRLLH